jgi:crotonobetainyl-CoA:carnitine CoA-transferase CaiB-like acyl-CoA transferase
MGVLVVEFNQRTRAQCIEALRQHGVPCGPINNIAEILAEPQIIHRQMLQYLPHPTAGQVPQIVSPLKLRQLPLKFEDAPPLLGADTKEILSAIGLGSDKQAELLRRGVI